MKSILAEKFSKKNKQKEQSKITMPDEIDNLFGEDVVEEVQPVKKKKIMLG